MSTAAEGATMDDEEADGSEYEYDENETETFYVTLDLSSYDQPKPKPFKSPVPTAQEPAAPSLLPNAISEQTPHPTVEPTTTPSPDPPSNEKTIQILDLPSTNPLILYDGQTYSCEWGATIGTDVIIAAREPIQDPALASTLEAELVGLSTTRLTGRPVRATRKPAAVESIQSIRREGNTDARPNDGNRNTTQVLEPINPGPTWSTSKKNQAAFINRIKSIKSARGETDIVTETVPGWSRQRAQDAAVRSRGRGRGRPRGRKRAVRRMGGLFRDLPAQAIEVAPAGGTQRGGGVGKTPVRWADLEERRLGDADGVDDEAPVEITQQTDGEAIEISDDESNEEEDEDDEREGDVEMQDA